MTSRRCGLRHAGRRIDLSVVIPALNAASALPATLAGLTPLAGAGLAVEVVVVDGGSGDATVAAASAGGARVVTAPRGRGRQLAAGAAAAAGRFLLFLHADTRLDARALGEIPAFLGDPEAGGRAGYFRFALDDDAPAARRLERWVARRCRWFVLPYGDQGLLINRTLYHDTGGFRPLPLMEDVELVRRLGRGRLVLLAGAAITSAERFRRNGYLRQSTRNLACLALYLLGVPTGPLARFYGSTRPPQPSVSA